jgi:hypothetical protein
MASQAVSAVAGIAPVAAPASNAASRGSGFTSGGVRVPARSAFARGGRARRVRTVVRANAQPEVRPRASRRARDARSRNPARRRHHHNPELFEGLATVSLSRTRVFWWI